MTEVTRKTRNAQVLKAATTLPAAYGVGWESAVFDSKGLDELKLLLTISGSFDATSFELKSMIADDLNTGTFFTELATAGTLDEASVAAAVITAEGDQVALSFGCQNFNLVKFRAKRTAGTQGTLALSVLGG